MSVPLAQLGNGLLFVGAVLFLVAAFKAIRAGQLARNAAYYSLRQGALNKTRLWSVIAVVILAATVGWAAYLSNQPEPVAVARLSTPTPAIATPSRMLPTETATVRPTLPATPTATPHPPTATATPKPSPTPAPTLPPNVPALLRTAAPAAASPVPNAKLAFTTLASTLDGKGTPLDPGLTFPVGTRNVRLFFQASKVNNGAMWSVLCYKGDKLVDSVVDSWEWGPRTQNARAFCALDGSSGSYRVESYLGMNKQFEVSFELLPATPTPVS